jgi:uncharacterized protein (DUF2267 family)
MDDREFYRTVADSTGLSKEEAADLTRATLEIVAMRVSPGEARDLARELPAALAECIRAGGRKQERYDVNELIRRVSTRTGLNEAETISGVRAVLQTLREAVEPKTFHDFMAQLPADFTRLAEDPQRTL